MLTQEKRRFAYQIVTTGNLKEAAEFVGIDLETAAEWFADEEINELMIHDRRAALITATETRERIIARYANVANSDIGDYLSERMPAADGEDGERVVGGLGWAMLKAPGELTKEQRQCIKKIKWTQHGPEIELHDPMKANDKLAEIFGITDHVKEDERPEDWAAALRELADNMEQVTSGHEATTYH